MKLGEKRHWKPTLASIEHWASSSKHQTRRAHGPLLGNPGPYRRCSPLSSNKAIQIHTHVGLPEPPRMAEGGAQPSRNFALPLLTLSEPGIRSDQITSASKHPIAPRLLTVQVQARPATGAASLNGQAPICGPRPTQPPTPQPRVRVDLDLDPPDGCACACSCAAGGTWQFAATVHPSAACAFSFFALFRALLLDMCMGASSTAL